MVRTQGVADFWTFRVSKKSKLPWAWNVNCLIIALGFPSNNKFPSRRSLKSSLFMHISCTFSCVISLTSSKLRSLSWIHSCKYKKVFCWWTCHCLSTMLELDWSYSISYKIYFVEWFRNWITAQITACNTVGLVPISHEKVAKYLKIHHFIKSWYFILRDGSERWLTGSQFD